MNRLQLFRATPRVLRLSFLIRLQPARPQRPRSRPSQRFFPGLVTVGLLSVVLAACAGGGGLDGTGADSAFDRVPALSVTEVNRFGNADGDGALGEVLGLTVNSDGLIHVIERGSRTVRAFGPDGILRFELGASGGPEAFSRPEEIGRDEERVWVFDRVRYQLSWFTGEALVEQTSFTGFEIPGDDFSYVTVGPLPGGHGRAIALVLPDIDGGRADIVRPVIRASPAGEVVDTLWMQRVANAEIEIDWFGGGGASAGPQPFSPDPVRGFSWADGAIVEVDYSAHPAPVMTVRKQRIGGALLFSTELPFVPSAITVREVDAVLDLISQGWRGRVETDEEIRTLFRDALVIPELRRPAQHVIAAEDGRTWIRLTPTAADGGMGPVPPHAVGLSVEHLAGDARGSRWIVLSAEGELEGRAFLPARFVPMWIDGVRVVGVTTDDSEVHRIVELRVDQG